MMVRYHSDIDSHAVLEVLVPGNECVAILVLKANAAGGAFVDPIEIFDRSDDGVGSVMGIDLDPHWNASPHLRGLVEQQLEGHMLWRRV